VLLVLLLQNTAEREKSLVLFCHQVTEASGTPEKYYRQRGGYCPPGHLDLCTVICFVSIIAKFGICTVVGLNGTLVEAKIRT
jgi:hypothetical protein